MVQVLLHFGCGRNYRWCRGRRRRRRISSSRNGDDEKRCVGGKLISFLQGIRRIRGVNEEEEDEDEGKEEEKV